MSSPFLSPREALPAAVVGYWQRLHYLARFSLTCLAGVIAIVTLAWIVFGFGSLGLDPTATVAAVLGISATAGLGIGLMALVFYSNRSGRDDLAGGETGGPRDPKPLI